MPISFAVKILKNGMEETPTPRRWYVHDGRDALTSLRKPRRSRKKNKTKSGNNFVLFETAARLLYAIFVLFFFHVGADDSSMRFRV